MGPRSKLRMALAAEKGVDLKKLKEKKKYKEAVKRKQDAEKARRGVEEGSDDDDDQTKENVEEGDAAEDSDQDEEEEMGNGVNLDGIDDSDTSESSLEMEKPIPRQPKKSILKATKRAEKEDNDEEEEDEEDEDEEDIPISDLEDLDDEDKEDLIPHTKLTINNTPALETSLNRIAIPTDKSVAFATHQTIVSSAPTADSIPDVSDDLQRELSFYSQSLEAVRQARVKLRAEGVPFSRPNDYFAEMVKEDAQMEKIKAKLVEEASNKKAAAEARKLRDLKKFGKQVQVAKLQERQKEKRETLEKIKTLKRKRQETGGNGDTHEADLFDVGIDKELANYKPRSDRSGPGRGAMGGPNVKRQKKNEKYGFGGKKRHAKSGDAMSSADLSGFNAKKMKAKGKVTKSARPGKSRRKAMSSR